jgi:hypothetical protein
VAKISSSPGLPWADPAHQSALEILAGQIASHIAGRTVTVRCEDQGNWAAIVSRTGGNPNDEAGFVATQWNSKTGQLISVSDNAELASGICLPLSRFAAATRKPTTCSPLTQVATPRASRRASHVQHTSRAAGVPCYSQDGRTAAAVTTAFWARYSAIAVAILTLAHESVHLGGTVGGRLANGMNVGDPRAEAKADCYGMQWMPYVAEQLGDTPDDALSLEAYVWENVYPLSRNAHPEYWSPDCHSGGALDAHLAGTSSVWP